MAGIATKIFIKTTSPICLNFLNVSNHLTVHQSIWRSEPHDSFSEIINMYLDCPTYKLKLESKTEEDVEHDDVIKWKHFPRNWPFVREIHRSPVNFPHKGQWRGALMFSLIYAWINDWVNNHEAGDLRRQHGHYDVIVMKLRGTALYRGMHDSGGRQSIYSWCVSLTVELLI